MTHAYLYRKVGIVLAEVYATTPKIAKTFIFWPGPLVHEGRALLTQRT